MVQVSLTNKGAFILIVGIFTFFLFWFSDGGGAGGFGSLSRTEYAASTNVISMRSVFLTGISAVEEGGRAIIAIRSKAQLSARTKAAKMSIDGKGTKKDEVLTEADLVSNQRILHRFRLMSADILVRLSIYVTS